MAAKVWDMVSNDIKNVNDIETFKTILENESQLIAIASYV